MGGGGSKEHHHYHTVYQVPPETQQQLQQQAVKIEALEKEAMDKGDPKLFEKNSKEAMNKFVENLSKLELSSIIKKNTGEIHIGFLGQISAGKTSLINAIFDKHLPVALGHCTDKCEVVHTEKLNVIWDVCGQNDDYKFYKPENLSFVKDLDRCVILFDNDIMMISNFLKVIQKINPNNMILVRTKLDQYDSGHARTITQEKELDKKKVKDLLGVDIEVYYVSAHNIVHKEGDKFDWDAFKQSLGLN